MTSEYPPTEGNRLFEENPKATRSYLELLSAARAAGNNIPINILPSRAVLRSMIANPPQRDTRGEGK